MKKYKRSSMKHTLAAVLFCLILSMGLVCHADEKGTVTVASAKIRASADPASEQLGSVALGGTVDIISETVGSDGNVWYQVYVDANTKGYIRGDLVEKSGVDSNAGTTTTTTTTTQQLPETVVTPTEARKAAVKSDAVSVRKGAGTSYAKVGTANRGTVVTVTGEATAADGAKWYQVSIMHQNAENIGFIRADLITFDEIPPDVATSNIVGENEGSGEAPEEQPQESEPQPEEQPQPEETSQPETSDGAQAFTPMDGGSLSYVMPGFVEASMSPYEGSEEKYEAYINGTFIIMYGRMQSGEEGWFLYDQEQNVYQRYVYTAENTSTAGSALSGSLLPMIALVIIIVILLAIIGLLFLKLREYRDDYGYDEDEDDYSEEDDIEDLEEEDDYGDERPARPPVRRPQQPNGQGAGGARPAQRPQGQPQRPQPQSNGQRAGGAVRQPQGGQPAQRPQGQPQRPQLQSNGQRAGGAVRQPQGGQPAQRSQGQPQGQPQRPNNRPQQGEAPVGRRPASANGQASQQSRSQRPQRPEGQPQRPEGQQPRPDNRPQQGNRPAQAQQQGAKARPILESEKEDMEFIDI
ncbi:MAG: SH3 domain-containing protein [Roseburia sp.]|nr:SH3 domain-containing protein [Roseburia sp.]